LGFPFEVGLAVESGVIAGGTENFWEDLLFPIEAVPVVHKAVFVAVFATHNDSAGRATDRVGAEGVFKEHAVGGELVDFWGGVDGFEPAVVGADGVGRVVVGEEKDDVGSLLFFTCLSEGDEG